MKKTAFLLMVITLFSKLFGFGRDLVLSYFFGASGISDSYLISLVVPSVIFGLIGTGIVTAYIPMQSRVLDESGEAEAARFTSNFTNIILVVVSVGFVLGMIFTQSIVRFFAMGFSGETLDITVKFTKITLFAMYFNALISIFSGYLQIKNNYVIPALIGFPLNVIVIISIVIAAKSNYIILAIGTLLAMASQFFLMVPFIKKTGFTYTFFFDFKDERIKNILFIALPVILGTSVNQINVLVDRTIASSLAVGAISALNYASRLNLFIQGLFVTSIITATYPMMSSYASKNNYSEIKKIIRESVNTIIIFVLPITLGTLIFSEEIISILFARGAFGASAAQMTSVALFFYAFGMLGFGFRDVLSRAFYSLQNTKTPMINAAIGVLINIVLNIVLSKYLGIGGLALATSIAATFTAFLLFVSLRKQIGDFGIRKILASFLKIFIASLVMAFLAKLSFNYFILLFSKTLALALAIGIGIIIYFAVVYFMKIDDADIIIRMIKSKFISS